MTSLERRVRNLEKTSGLAEHKLVLVVLPAGSTIPPEDQREIDAVAAKSPGPIVLVNRLHPGIRSEPNCEHGSAGPKTAANRYR